ncbi:hypothetical protein A2U01_0097585, partial [Trifolium medium]|nr:hypothetical protein [Trifolium medium]
MGGEFEEEGIE